MSIGESGLLEFERAATVALVATHNLVRFRPLDRVHDVLSDPRHLDLDHFPVMAEGRTLGVLSRSEHWESTVRDQIVQELMEPIRPDMLVAKSDPLISVIERMSEGPPFRLVLEIGEVNGILTLSDLGRLASRAVVFSRITHLEMLLARYIRARCSEHDESWLSLLSENRRDKLEKTYRELVSSHQNLDLVSAAQFCDKRVACCKLGLAVPELPGSPRAALEKFERLRDQLAHAMSGFDEGERARETACTVRDLGMYVSSLMRQLSGLENS
jgi:hypothetical protein